MTPEEVLKEFCNDIDAIGGVIELYQGFYIIPGDDEWHDLATTYIHACEALGRKPEMYVDPDADPTEPDEGDLTTEDHIHFWEHGMNRRFPVLIVADSQDWKQALRDYMEHTNFYPNVWFISDHGNAHLLSLEKE